LIIFDRSKDFTQEDLDKFNKHYGRANNISPQLKKYVGTNMGDAIAKRDSMTMVKNIEGRYTDGKMGGTRSQTYTLNTAKAKEIVAQSKIKNTLQMSIKPLVDRKGPYKHFYNQGSHSDVPFVRIVDGKGNEVYPKDTPNVQMSRGDTSEKTILVTDLCGKKIS